MERRWGISVTALECVEAARIVPYSTCFPVSCRNDGWLPSRSLSDRVDLMEDTFKFEGCKGQTVMRWPKSSTQIFSGLLSAPSWTCGQLLWAGSSSLASGVPRSEHLPCVFLLALQFLWRSGLGLPGTPLWEVNM